MAGYAVFLFSLLQDVNILRPLIVLAAQAGLNPILAVSADFRKRDTSRQWAMELDEIRAIAQAGLHEFTDVEDAVRKLPPSGGILVAGSESNLAAHSMTHDIFRAAPSSYTTITLQHGFECIGFLQSRDHIAAHGLGVTFAADIICGWQDADQLTSLTPSQRQKLVVTGPSTLIQMRLGGQRNQRPRRGLVCENLHSVRFKTAGDFKMDFMSVFDEFCAELEAHGEGVTLRPHPGGQYVLKNDVSLRSNVTLNNNPIYKVDLSKYGYGISAPSSILIDMVLAGMPVAVWRDSTSKMDSGNFSGLAEVSTVQDWLDFAAEAQEHPEQFLQVQQQFLESKKMLIDPRAVQQRFINLFRSLAPANRHSRSYAVADRRIMFVANGMLPTLQLSFIKPLAKAVEERHVETGYLTEQMLTEKFKSKVRSDDAVKWILKRLDAFRPSHLVFCRYSGPHADVMVDWARRNHKSVLFHIDDDLLSIPADIGERKYKMHNAPDRLATVKFLLDRSDLVYASTERLKTRLEALGAKAQVAAGHIYCSGEILRSAENRPVRTFGYMASADHAHNLEWILPAIVGVLRGNPDVSFELFGSIPKPSELEEFGQRVKTAPPIANYETFLEEFSKRNWDIGICPLSPIPFNMMKANTKWVEYTSVGIAVVASRDTVYDDCCADGAGILASTVEEWQYALESLIRDPDLRHRQVQSAQGKLVREYTLDQLRDQVFQMLDRGSENRHEAG